MEATGQGWYYRTQGKTASLSGAPPSHHNASVAEQQAQKKTLGVLCPHCVVREYQSRQRILPLFVDSNTACFWCKRVEMGINGD